MMVWDGGVLGDGGDGGVLGDGGMVEMVLCRTIL